MKTHVFTALLLAGALAPAFYLNTSSAADSESWQYTLLPESQLTDDCPICDGLVFPVPLRGTFLVRFLDSNLLYTRYSWEAIAWTAGTAGGSFYKITGQGIYEVGGEVALVQTSFLTLTIDDGASNQVCYFTNTTQTVSRPWPAIQISFAQTNGTELQQYSLDLSAAPVREIWFSTTRGLHAQIWQAPTNYISPGDLISTAGRVIKRNQQLTANLGIVPVPDLGLDALDLLPGGEIAFSIGQDCFSETLGQLYNGDVLSEWGRVVTNYAALISAFTARPPTADIGLDALQFMPDDEIYFSVTNDLALGQYIRHGDLLSSRGVIVKSNQELLAAFHPADPNKDYGLDAIYVWPDGEIWFSVEIGFEGQHFESYRAGDLLSDRGYVVYRNLDLVAAFQPLEDLLDFGLDSLFVVTDLATTPDPAGSLRLSPIGIDQAARTLTLDWEGLGKVFQLEKATNISGPWLPLSPILIEPPVVDQLSPTNAQGFYRVRQW